MPPFAPSRYSDAELPGLVADVCRAANRASPASVSQSQFDDFREAAGHPEAPTAKRICARLHRAWEVVKAFALDPTRNVDRTVDAREWAQRGLAAYGGQAARQEAVDDLHKRIAHATLKLETMDAPREERRRPIAVSTEHPVSETLLCSSCGQSFERLRTRGRKPKLCPTCRGLTVVPASSP